MIQASNITKHYGGLRAFVPEGAVDLGLVTMAVCVGEIPIRRFHRSTCVTTLAVRSVSDAALVGATH